MDKPSVRVCDSLAVTDIVPNAVTDAKRISHIHSNFVPELDYEPVADEQSNRNCFGHPNVIRNSNSIYFPADYSKPDAVAEPNRNEYRIAGRFGLTESEPNCDR